jgi:hypothetical protein
LMAKCLRVPTCPACNEIDLSSEAAEDQKA